MNTLHEMHGFSRCLESPLPKRQPEAGHRTTGQVEGQAGDVRPSVVDGDVSRCTRVQGRDVEPSSERVTEMGGRVCARVKGTPLAVGNPPRSSP